MALRENRGVTDDWRTSDLANWEARVPLHSTWATTWTVALIFSIFRGGAVRHAATGDIAGLDVVHLQRRIGLGGLFTALTAAG